jgi:hypothetical protein
MKRMATQDPSYCQENTPTDTVPFDRLKRIGRARGVEPAPRGKQRGYGPLIHADQGEQDALHVFRLGAGRAAPRESALRIPDLPNADLMMATISAKGAAAAAGCGTTTTSAPPEIIG